MPKSALVISPLLVRSSLWTSLRRMARISVRQLKFEIRQPPFRGIVRRNNKAAPFGLLGRNRLHKGSSVLIQAGPGFVQLGPSDTMVNGATSNINPTRAEETVANAFIVPTGTGGRMGVYTSNATHIVIDVTGYMTA